MSGLGVFHSAELPFVFGNDDYPLGHMGASGAPISAERLDLLAYHGFDPALLHRPTGWWDATTGKRLS